MQVQQPSTCMDTDYSSVVITALEGSVPDTDVQAYPNPFFGQLTIAGLTPGTEVQLLTLPGQVVETRIARTSELTIHLGSIPRGTYVLRAGAETRLVVRQ
jgi:hypothetical protein